MFQLVAIERSAVTGVQVDIPSMAPANLFGQSTRWYEVVWVVRTLGRSLHIANLVG